MEHQRLKLGGLVTHWISQGFCFVGLDRTGLMPQEASVRLFADLCTRANVPSWGRASVLAGTSIYAGNH